jgi:hypothetical protein
MNFYFAFQIDIVDLIKSCESEKIGMCHCYISYCKNQCFCFGMSFVAGGDIWGAMWPGSLAFKETWQVI